MLMHWSSLCSSAPAYMLHHIIVRMCITKMYDMLNKNSLGLLKKGAAKQSRIKRIEAPVRARAQPVVK